MKDALVVSLFSMIPRRWSSSLLGRLSRSLFSRLLLRWFVWNYGIDLNEAERSHPRDYASLGDLFSRALKPGSREIDPSTQAFVSPVDGTVALCARGVRGSAEIAPGRSIDLSALIGEDTNEPWDVLVCYLSPRDYHRVHTPCDGSILKSQHHPGERWPVFPSAVRGVRDLFSRNERVVLSLKSPHGPLTLVMVGAFGVGHITWPDGGVATTDPMPFDTTSKGAWLGTFELGSTVILLTPPDLVEWRVAKGDAVRVGQRIGIYKESM